MATPQTYRTTHLAAFAAIYAGDPADLNFTQCNPIPAVSDWAVAVTALLMLTTGTISMHGARPSLGTKGLWQPNSPKPHEDPRS